MNGKNRREYNRIVEKEALLCQINDEETRQKCVNDEQEKNAHNKQKKRLSINRMRDRKKNCKVK